MSAFLGPIHYWLYNKIQLQNKLTECLLDTLPAFEKASLNAQLSNKYRSPETRPLEEVIDTANIHGWLQNEIAVCETRLAAAVTSILKINGDIKVLVQAAQKFGSENPLEEKSTVAEEFEALEDVLLNGMPCDHVNVVTESASDYVSWRQSCDIHEKYWQSVGGDKENYYILRKAMVNGMLNKSGYEYFYSDGNFTLRKEC